MTCEEVQGKGVNTEKGEVSNKWGMVLAYVVMADVFQKS